MFVFCNVICLLLLVVCEQSLTVVTDDLMLELYSKYVSAVSNDNFLQSTRRLFKNNKDYEIHVKKLKEVNGYKKHNLFVKENSKMGGRESYIYINNPVESKTPKAYLTLEEFKNALMGRVLAQKNEFISKPTITGATPSYRNNLRPNIVKETTQQNKYISQRERTVNIKERENLKTNNDPTKYNTTVNKNLQTYKYLNKKNTTISLKIVSAENNNVHEKNVTNLKKNAENNVTTYLFTNVTEAYKNVETEIGVKSQDIIENTKIRNTKEIENTEKTENTEVTESKEVTLSHSSNVNSEKSELLTENTTIFENTVQFEKEISKIVTNIEVANTSFNIKEEPRRKKTRSFSVSFKKRRSTLGRPLVFFGNR